jgi:PilZ domain
MQRRNPKLETQKQPATVFGVDIPDKRRQPRFKLEAAISINSRTCGRLKGQTVDISESGIAAILKLEVPLGELVELEFTLPSGPVIVYAMVRQRRAFRYGFQFVKSAPSQEIIQAACRELAVEQSLLGDL